MKQLTSMTASALSALLQNKEISSYELTEAFINRIRTCDDDIGAYLTVCAEQALHAAQAIDQRRLNGETLPALAGIPMALKDNICTKGIRTTCASKLLSNYVPTYSATVYERLLQNGAVLLGKLNMDEFAMGSSTENSAFRITRNPHNLAHVPGGSSGGSAAAVAADEAAYTLGTDTGGSVRQPAAFCGVVGLRPTYGRISRYGLFALACSLDQAGILTKDVRDNAMVLQAIAGKDAKDMTAASVAVPDYTASLGTELRHLRIGIPKGFISRQNTDEVGQAVLRAVHQLEEMGAQLIELSSAMAQNALQAYHILTETEAASNLARFDGVRYGNRSKDACDLQNLYCNTRGEGLGSEVKRRILYGTYLLRESQRGVYYEKALYVRQHIKRVFAESFALCDVIVTPTSPDTAYRFGEKRIESVQMYDADRFTVPASLADLPSLSVPCGKSKAGLPIGMQLTAPAFREDLLYRVAYAYEQECRYGTV